MPTLRSRPDFTSDEDVDADRVAEIIAGSMTNLLSHQIPKYYSNAAEICLRTLLMADLIGDYSILSTTAGSYSTAIEVTFRLPGDKEWYYVNITI